MIVQYYYRLLKHGLPAVPAIHISVLLGNHFNQSLRKVGKEALSVELSSAVWSTVVTQLCKACDYKDL